MMKNVKMFLLASLASFMMVTSTMANPISNDADLIFSNDASQVQLLDLAKLSATEMQETEGAWGPVIYYGGLGLYYGARAATVYGTYHVGSWGYAYRTWRSRW